MERIGIYFRLKPGMQEEYKKRHDEIWPEITQAFNEAGIHNFTVWNEGLMLFSYFEADDYDRAQQVLDSNQVYSKWRKYMEGIVDIDKETGQKEWFMRLMFFHP